MKKNIYITIVPNIINEGGMARNKAFFDFFKNRNDLHIFNLKYKNIFQRFFQTLLLIKILITTNKANIFIHETVLVSLFPLKMFKYDLFARFFLRIMITADEKNNLFIEINDLPFEQAKDLDLEFHYGQENFQKSIFGLKNAKYAFASSLMKDYSIEKYKIKNKCETIINAGPKRSSGNSNQIETVKTLINKDKVSYVYCGTLNKGRQIEKMLETFESKNNYSQLFLLGADGEWIKERKNSSKIYYLGNFEEDTAHSLVSLFDVGLVPYDNTRFYYNICYPTKISFYLTAGLPVICTPLKELKYWFCDKNFVIFEDIDNWNDLFSTIQKKSLSEIRKGLNQLDYTWEHILKNSGVNNFFS
jgi:hypothetical protein